MLGQTLLHDRITEVRNRMQGAAAGRIMGPGEGEHNEKVRFRLPTLRRTRRTAAGQAKPDSA